MSKLSLGLPIAILLVAGLHADVGALASSDDPATAQSGSVISHLAEVNGDTYVFKLNSGDDDGFTIEEGSGIGLAATYDDQRRDMAFAFGWTNLADTSHLRLGYSNDRGSRESHVEVLTNTPYGIEVSHDRSDGHPATPGTVGVGFDFDAPVHFESGDWYFVVAAPEAREIEVRIGLAVSDQMSILAEAGTDTGEILPEDEFDGVAQTYSVSAGLAGVLMEATAEAPAGTKAFSTMFQHIPGAGAGRWGIDGPGDADDETTSASVRIVLRPSWAQVLAGPAGEYTHWVHADAWAGPGPLYRAGRVAVFFAAPMPL